MVKIVQKADTWKVFTLWHWSTLSIAHVSCCFPTYQLLYKQILDHKSINSCLFLHFWVDPSSGKTCHKILCTQIVCSSVASRNQWLACTIKMLHHPPISISLPHIGSQFNQFLFILWRIWSSCKVVNAPQTFLLSPQIVFNVAASNTIFLSHQHLNAASGNHFCHISDHNAINSRLFWEFQVDPRSETHFITFCQLRLFIRWVLQIPFSLPPAMITMCWHPDAFSQPHIGPQCNRISSILRILSGFRDIQTSYNFLLTVIVCKSVA